MQAFAVSKYEIESWQCGSMADMWLNSFEDSEMGAPPLDKITLDERKSYETYFPYSKI